MAVWYETRDGNSELYMRLLDEHRREEADHSRKVWTVLIFCIWHAIFVERSLDPGIQRNQSALLTKPVVGSMVH